MGDSQCNATYNLVIVSRYMYKHYIRKFKRIVTIIICS